MFDFIRRFIAAFKTAYAGQMQVTAPRMGEPWIRMALESGSREATLLMGKPSPEVFKEYHRRRGIQEQLAADEDLEDEDSGADAA
jgi:hypothetical protein